MKEYRYITLNDKELAALREGYKNGSTFQFRQSCHCMLLSREGLKVSEIAALFQIKSDTVLQRMNRWSSAGISGLCVKKGRGRKPTLNIVNESDVEAVKKKSKNNL